MFFLDKTDWFIKTEILQNPYFPIIVNSIEGNCVRGANGHSWQNQLEAATVVDYVNKLLDKKWNNMDILPSDIGSNNLFFSISYFMSFICSLFTIHLFLFHISGIVTPYRAQCRLICDTLKRHGRDVGLGAITIGTAECFQGQERPIIIVSTVRTNGELGFVNSERVNYF